MPLFLLAGCLLLAACQNSALTTQAPVATLMPPPAAASPLAAYPGAQDSASTVVVQPDAAATAYPLPATPEPTATGASYPAAATPGQTEIVDVTATDAIYFPVIGEGDEPTAEPTTAAPATTPSPTATSTIAPTATTAAVLAAQPTPINVADFAAARADLAAQGRQLAYNKIGFHVTFLEDGDQLDPYMERLDAEGVPFFLKAVDNAEPIYKAQELMKDSGVPHVLVYRSTLYDVPDYEMDPIQAAEMYWELEKEIWPPELDPDLVWFETMNELDKNRAGWLAQYGLRTAQLALRDGYRWAGFGWASGEPEPSDWESPAMLELLRLIGKNPDRLAIALHEYSYTADDIAHDYPHKVGRFLDLFSVADRHGIPRPTVLITEWGWTYDNIPPEPLAMEDITWAARLYGAYPEVLGAAVWNLGKLGDRFFPLNTQTSELIDNMLAFSLDSYFSAPTAPAPLDANLFPPP